MSPSEEEVSASQVEDLGDRDGDGHCHSRRLLSPHRSVVRLVVQEGKHRMVRRMLHNVGHSVLQLRRERFGGICLDGLPPGECRAISAAELSWVLSFYKKLRFAARKKVLSVKKGDGEKKEVGGGGDSKSKDSSSSGSKQSSTSATERLEFKVVGKDKKKIDEWRTGSLGAKGSRRFQ
jgi:hypothetical protein